MNFSIFKNLSYLRQTLRYWRVFCDSDLTRVLQLFRSSLPRFSRSMPASTNSFQESPNFLKGWSSAPLVGLPTFTATCLECTSRTWWRQGTWSILWPRASSILIQAPFHAPVFEAVVSKHMPANFSDGISHSWIRSRTPWAISPPVPSAIAGTPSSWPKGRVSTH